MAKKVGPECKHFQQNDMPREHRCDAKVAVILEAPGRMEDEDPFGRPIVGPTGWTISEWWNQVGLRRGDFYIDNTYPYRPPDNKLFLIPRDRWLEAAADMVWRLKRQDVNVVVPCGNYALRALFPDRKMNISDWRGSILEWNGRKCIPTFHPAVTQRQRVLTKLCLIDWARIAEHRESKEWKPLARRLVIDPSREELAEWRRAAVSYFWPVSTNAETPPNGETPKVLSLDVENSTKGKRELLCIGLSFDQTWSITVPTVRRDFVSERDFTYAQDWLVGVLELGFPLVMQNGMTDLWKLVMWAPQLREVLQKSYVWDLIELAHMLDPNDGGSTEEGSSDELDDDGGVRVGMLDLGTLVSIHGDGQPYYKHLGASPQREVRQQYNGLDACTQRGVFDKLWNLANERKLV